MRAKEHLQKPRKEAVSAVEEVVAESVLKMVSAMGEGVALLGVDGRIRKVNPAFAALTDYNAHDLEGQAIQRLLPEIFEADAQAIEEKLVSVLLKHSPPDREDALQVITPNGTHKWVVPTLSHIKSIDGSTAALVFTMRDVTTLVNAQEARIETERAYRDRLRRLADRLASTKEQERRDVATQLHDTVIQSLSLCNIRLGSLREQVVDPGAASDLSRDVDEIRRMVDAALIECRSILAELTPPLLYELGLGPALHDLAEKCERLYGASIRLQEESCLKEVPPPLLGVLFEAIRELVVNAIKHAGDCLIRIHARQDGEDLVVEVCDDGAGFDGHATEGVLSHETTGFGLFNTRERLLHIGSTLDIRSAPGQGTTATVRIPLRTHA